ncbi:gluconokinase [Aurantimonas sp. A2-1-M11]|uniref:gluconokinase n=1 Tax=Aurantimonas sp. A2-1-M11 TaxID=3113712 RepID=UPI002F91C9ED
MTETSPQMATSLVVMGPAGVGKTTTAASLAGMLGWPYAEADEFHPAANITKMESGTPLDDKDRAPWLAAIRDWISDEAAAGRSTVVTCSALKRSYRDLLRGAQARVRFVCLTATPDLVGRRMATRQGHFMPVSLLKSQFDTFQPLEADEDGIVVSVDLPPDEVVATALRALRLSPVPRAG